MTHVSRFPVEKDVYVKILNELYCVLAYIREPAEMKQFLGEFFTKTERIMLAKRFALVGMLLHGYETDIIKNVLHVSTGTIYRMREKLDKGEAGFKLGIRKMMKKEALDQFIQALFRRPHSSGFHPLADT